MPRIHPQALLSSSSSSYFSSHQETFTVWMKSLILRGKGCTVFDSSGRIVYRVDNYDSTSCGKVYLMDFRGKVLFTILKRKYGMFGCWEGFRSTGAEIENGRSCDFRVRRSFISFLRGKSSSEVVVGVDKHKLSHYKMDGLTSKSSCKIEDNSGGLVAEVKRKASLRDGVVYGEEVLTMEVKPYVDHSLIMGLVVVHCLINRRM